MPVRGVRRRYLAVKVHSDLEIEGVDLFNAIGEKTRFIYGVVGSSKMDYKSIDYEGRVAIIRCSHLWLSQMRAVIASIKEVNKVQVSLQVIRVSGTIKTLRRKIKEDFLAKRQETF